MYSADLIDEADGEAGEEEAEAIPRSRQGRSLRVKGVVERHVDEGGGEVH
jgi:hypothetical protein